MDLSKICDYLEELPASPADRRDWIYSTEGKRYLVYCQNGLVAGKFSVDVMKRYPGALVQRFVMCNLDPSRAIQKIEADYDLRKKEAEFQGYTVESILRMLDDPKAMPVLVKRSDQGGSDIPGDREGSNNRREVTSMLDEREELDGASEPCETPITERDPDAEAAGADPATEE